jgi:hypothetical protein
MMEIILATPVFHFYLLFVVVLLATALWTRETGRPVGEPRGPARTTGLDRILLRSSALQPQRDRRPFRDLQAALSASYAGKLQQAIRTIRIGPPAGARRTDEATG